MNNKMAIYDVVKNCWGYDSGNVGFIPNYPNKEKDTEQDGKIKDNADAIADNVANDAEQQRQIDENTRLNNEQTSQIEYIEGVLPIMNVEDTTFNINIGKPEVSNG